MPLERNSSNSNNSNSSGYSSSNSRQQPFPDQDLDRWVQSQADSLQWGMVRQAAEQLVEVLQEGLEGATDWNDFLDKRGKLHGLRTIIGTVQGLATTFVINEMNKYEKE